MKSHTIATFNRAIENRPMQLNLFLWLATCCFTFTYSRYFKDTSSVHSVMKRINKSTNIHMIHQIYTNYLIAIYSYVIDTSSLRPSVYP